eukprot:1673228-Prymnesium_polylepis.1
MARSSCTLYTHNAKPGHGKRCHWSHGASVFTAGTAGPGRRRTPEPELGLWRHELDCSMEELQIEPGSELASLRDQLMAPSPDKQPLGAEEKALGEVPVKKAFGRLIGKPRSSTSIAAKVVPPPRSTEFVGGCEIDKKKNRRRPDPLSAERKAMNMRAREAANLGRSLRAETSGKHLNNERTHHWAGTA